MAIRKLTTTNAFIAFDLPDAQTSVGIVRCAPKILQGGAKEMARSLTYQYACLGMKVAGASAGINADPDDRAEAIANFVDEVAPLTESGEFLVDPGKGVDGAALAALHGADARDDVRLNSIDGVAMHDRLVAVGAAAAAAQAVPAMQGQTVLIEGFNGVGVALAKQLAADGASVVGISTTKGSVHLPFGLDVDVLAATWAEHGPAMVEHLGVDVQPTADLFGKAAGVLFVGSKMGIVDHKTAEKIEAEVIVPTAPLPYTTKAAINLGRAGKTLLPDFVTTAGPVFASWPNGGSSVEEVTASASESIGNLTAKVLEEASKHDVIPVLAACMQAEEFLGTWQETLPFGRPFAP